VGGAAQGSGREAGGIAAEGYDFVEDRTHDGRKIRLLNVVDEFTHECLAIRVARKLKAADVIDVLSDLFILRGVPGHIRSDNGPEFVAKQVQTWIAAVGAKTAYIEKGTLRWHSTRDASGTFASSARGRTATWKASTPGCATSCSTARSSTACARPRL
jgi:transposase InsO family protein